MDWDSDEEKEKAPKEDEGMISQTAKVVGDMGSSMAKGALHGLEAIEHGLGIFSDDQQYDDSDGEAEAGEETTWFAPVSRVLEWDKVQPPRQCRKKARVVHCSRYGAQTPHVLNS